MTLHPFWRSMLRPGATEAVFAEVAAELDREGSRYRGVIGLYLAHRMEKRNADGFKISERSYACCG